MFPFDENILDIMRQTVTIKQPLYEDDGSQKTDRYGNAEYDEETTYRCRITTKPTTVRNASGEVTVANGRVLIAPAIVIEDQVILLDNMPLIQPDAEITFPDGSKPAIISISNRDLGDDDDPSFEYCVLYTT